MTMLPMLAGLPISRSISCFSDRYTLPLVVNPLPAHPCDRTSAMDGAVQPIARNLRRWRRTRELTLTALYKQAGVAQSTVSLIERGQGNPSIDTVWALAAALGVPFASLFHDEPPTDDVTVVRSDDASVIAVDQAGLETDGLVIRHLL